MPSDNVDLEEKAMEGLLLKAINENDSDAEVAFTMIMGMLTSNPKNNKSVREFFSTHSIPTAIKDELFILILKECARNELYTDKELEALLTTLLPQFTHELRAAYYQALTQLENNEAKRLHDLITDPALINSSIQSLQTIFNRDERSSITENTKIIENLSGIQSEVTDILDVAIEAKYSGEVLTGIMSLIPFQQLQLRLAGTQGARLLELALRKDDAGLFIATIKNGADKATALHLAAAKGSVALMEKMLAHDKTKINSQNDDGETALTIAAAHNPKVITLLLKHGADTHHITSPGRQTFLEIMAANHPTAVPEVLAHVDKETLYTAKSPDMDPLVKRLLTKYIQSKTKSTNDTDAVNIKSALTSIAENDTEKFYNTYKEYQKDLEDRIKKRGEFKDKLLNQQKVLGEMMNDIVNSSEKVKGFRHVKRFGIFKQPLGNSIQSKLKSIKKQQEGPK